MTYFARLKKNKMSLVAAGIQTLLYTLSGGVGYHLIIDPLCDSKGMDETIYYIKQFFQEQVRARQPYSSTRTSLTPLSMVNDFDNDIILFAYDIILKYGMILYMISDMIS